MKSTLLAITVYCCFFALNAQNPGSLDLSFANNGIEVTDIPAAFQRAAGLMSQPDGKILAWGSYQDAIPSSLVRYSVDGKRDSSFATNGLYTLTNYGVTGLTYSELWSVDLQSDGKIIMAGVHQRNTGTDLFVHRLTANGVKDNSFGFSGFIRISLVNFVEPFGHTVYIRVLPDNKILVFTGGKTNNKFTLIRLQENGAFDNTFGVNGTLEFSTEDNTTYKVRASGIYLLDDGKLLLYGHSTVASPLYSQCHLFKLMPDGTPDNSFGVNGEFRRADGYFDLERRRLAFQPDGKILLFAINKLYRINANGTADNTFGTGGSLGFGPSINGVTTQADGKILLTGTFNSQGILVRVNAGGTIDGSFGSSGYYYSSAATSISHAIQQSSGKVVAFGTKSGDFVLSRHYAQVLSDAPTPVSDLAVKLFPNPAGDVCSLSFELLQSEKVQISIYNVAGQLVQQPEPGAELTPGRHTYTLQTGQLPSGMYFICLQGNGWICHEALERHP